MSFPQLKLQPCALTPKLKWLSFPLSLECRIFSLSFHEFKFCPPFLEAFAGPKPPVFIHKLFIRVMMFPPTPLVSFHLPFTFFPFCPPILVCWQPSHVAVFYLSPIGDCCFVVRCHTWFSLLRHSPLVLEGVETPSLDLSSNGSKRLNFSAVVLELFPRFSREISQVCFVPFSTPTIYSCISWPPHPFYIYVAPTRLPPPCHQGGVHPYTDFTR